RLFFPRAPHWTVAPAIVALMMSLPVTWLLAHPAMLEAAIAGGQCFIFLGLYFAMTALETSKPRCPSLLIAGICWALSWGCRLSLVPAIGAIALLTFLELRGHGKNRRSVSAWIMPAIALATPLTIGAVGMLFYNRARFGSWTQTGWDYQLAWMNHHALAGKGFLVSPRYIPTNLYRYLIELPAFGRNFPYLFIQRGAHGPVRLFHPPDLLALELTGGILWSAPFCLFALGLLVPSKPTGSNESSQFSTAPRELFRWFTRCLLAACVLAMGPVLCGIGSVERYLGDGAPALLMLAVLGAWRLLARTRDGSRSRWNLIGAIVSLATMTAIFGILLLFEA
ncbi:MAG TPA: hypothetical protein VFC46_09710, partial [Humisphaera sp.]|nr:hypothetical protein [Humisphaera sp.]